MALEEPFCAAFSGCRTVGSVTTTSAFCLASSTFAVPIRISPDPDQFRASFQRFMARFSEQLPDGVEVNGRGFGRWFVRAGGGSAPHTNNAWGL
jgi:hypothetical protein